MTIGDPFEKFREFIRATMASSGPTPAPSAIVTSTGQTRVDLSELVRSDKFKSDLAVVGLIRRGQKK